MKKYLLLFSLSAIFLLFLAIFQFSSIYDGKLHVIFCSVGQGDAILLKTPEEKFVLVDGGPDASVLNCLSRHMPFWQREIHLAILTHPHADHFMGFLTVFHAYTVDTFATESVENTSVGYKALLSLVSEKHIPKQQVSAGMGIGGDNFSLLFVGPTKEKLAEVSPSGQIGQSSEQEVLETLVQYKNFRLLLTADSQVEELKEAERFISGSVRVLQAPHHGSSTGLEQELLDYFRPQLAIISVGKNTYGHPSTATISLLRNEHIPVLRTDEKGDIEMVSDGSSFAIRTR